VGAWKAILPGFEATHHQVGNLQVAVRGTHADVSCYGTATHFLPNPTGSSLWTVVGTYDFHLGKAGEAWKITTMRFHLKYQDGNTTLPALAKERLSSSAVPYDRNPKRP
jgi:hypothetical protein